VLRKRRQKQSRRRLINSEKMPMTDYSKKTAADYVKVIMVYCPLWISGCRLTGRFKMAGRVLY